ncbi:hypothetical protein ASG29_08945 [Sphingomonas sp. Leaf412]|uniref:FecR family protein n=1 Tax=Sphingomonas sp. Leaf412 TaxID=1736370 RepID=UPI0006FFCBB2|nr:FecR domain-containing protein [Sphingomonas sp. Leaf412]KQT31980.1 hypothetical protein ASG29_08945 [Sphingomonas sp. Leaf412]
MSDRHWNEAAEIEGAVDWSIRTASPDFDDWDAFGDWMDGDARRPALLERVGAAAAFGERFAGHDDDVAADGATGAAAEGPVASAPGRWPGFLPIAMKRMMPIGAVAAVVLAIALAVVLAVRPQLRGSRDIVTVASADGGTREIRLRDGTVVGLSGTARLQLDRGDARWARLDRGQALFRVRHDPARPFTVVAEGQRLVDAGTVFEVAVEPAGLRVDVAEGAVLVNPDRTDVRLDPGQGARIADGRVVLVSIPAGDVGRWSRPSMRYRDAALSTVAADLSIALGRDVRVSPDLRAERFTGVVSPAGLRDNPADVEALFGVQVVRAGDAWKMRRP